MIDTMTNKSLLVSTGEGARSYIIVALEQLDRVTALLDANQVRYWVDEEVLSLDGKPEVAFITLGHGTDATRVQNLLDSLP